MVRKVPLAVLAGGLALLVGGAGLFTVAVMGIALFVGSGTDPAPAPAADGGDCGGSGGAPAVPVLGTGPRIATLDVRF